MNRLDKNIDKIKRLLVIAESDALQMMQFMLIRKLENAEKTKEKIINN